MAVDIVPGTDADVFEVLADLRPIDMLELSLTSADPVGSIARGWKASSYRGVFRVDGRPVVVFGVAPCAIQAGDGNPWMVATPEIVKVPRQFLQASRHVVDNMRRGFVELRNATHKDNTVSLSWLRWLGFRVSDEPVGPGGVFRIFSMPGDPAKE